MSTRQAPGRRQVHDISLYMLCIALLTAECCLTASQGHEVQLQNNIASNSDGAPAGSQPPQASGAS